MDEFGIAALQTDWGDGCNLERVRESLDEVTDRYPWFELAILPELAVVGPHCSAAVALPGAEEDALRQVAADYKVWLIPGSLYECSQGRVYNTAPVIGPNGDIVARYRKIYPFCPYESDVFPGRDFCVFDVPGVARFGLLICYDIWFPEVLRNLGWLGAEILLHPILTNTVERDVEIAMARGSAAQHQIYIVSVNSAGGGHMGYGRSVVVGPDGDVVYEAGSGAEIVTAMIDPERVRRSRERGLLGLGQPLKSFRDVDVDFPAYAPGARRRGAFGGLGPLSLPRRRR